MGQIAKFRNIFGLDFALAIGPYGLGLLHDPSVGLHSSYIILDRQLLRFVAKIAETVSIYGQKVPLRANRLGLLSHLWHISLDFSEMIVISIIHNVLNQRSLIILQWMQLALHLHLVCPNPISHDQTQQQLLNHQASEI